jgi:predicted rRNA methylase YqxC with S4 and FtsJ domains
VCVGEAARALGLAIKGFASSGLAGPKGNRESFIWCTTEGPGIANLEAAARTVEP